jgi:SAM-dependent methyltransferase
MTGDDVHPAAREGFKQAADSYTRGRPEYPPEIVDWLRNRASLGPGTLAIELGAGTGKFTRSLLRTGARVIAVEPVEAMRAHLASNITAAQVVEGSAQSIPAPSACADAVVCAQSFHWFATREALTEIHRVLKPGGTLALVWNTPDEGFAWVVAIREILTAYDVDCPQQFRHGNWRKVFPDPRFSELTYSLFSHSHTGTAEQVIIERAKSLSYIASLPASTHAAVVNKLKSLVASEPQLRNQPEIAFPYLTLAYHCRKQ